MVNINFTAGPEYRSGPPGRLVISDGHPHLPGARARSSHSEGSGARTWNRFTAAERAVNKRGRFFVFVFFCLSCIWREILEHSFWSSYHACILWCGRCSVVFEITGLFKILVQAFKTCRRLRIDRRWTISACNLLPRRLRNCLPTFKPSKYWKKKQNAGEVVNVMHNKLLPLPRSRKSCHFVLNNIELLYSATFNSFQTRRS